MWSLCLLKKDTIISGDENGDLVIWSIKDQEEIKTINSAHDYKIMCISLIGLDRICTTSRDTTVKVWQLNLYN